jgi:hypothetical protein
MSGRQGPPDNSNAPDHVTEDGDGNLTVGKRPEEKRSEELDTLKKEVNWNNAPDWARLLHLEIEQLREEM